MPAFADLGRVGLWSASLRRGDPEAAVEAAIEIERLGFKAVWMPGGEAGLAGHLDRLLAATSGLILAIGIVNIWTFPAPDVAALHHRLRTRHPGRFRLGLGIGHRPLVEQVTPGVYTRPFHALDAYLDELDAGAPGVSAGERVLAALGPRMLGVSRERAAGAHPYLVTPEHTRMARACLGPDRLLAPEQHAVLEKDPAVARAIARRYLTTYWTLPNYMRNFERMGFNDDDLASAGSDRMVDALVAWGDIDQVLNRVQAHLDAGADHVCVQFLSEDRLTFPVAAWRRLAAAAGIH